MNSPVTTTQCITGFILTRQWRDIADGLELIYWVHSDTGIYKVIAPKQEAVCFVPQANCEQVLVALRPATSVRVKPIDLKSFRGDPVAAVYFKSQRDLLRARDSLQSIGVELIEADIRPTERFLMERFVTGPVTLHCTSPPSPATGYSLVDQPIFTPADYTPELNIVSLDIETSLDGKRLFSIACSTADDGWVFMVGDEPVPEEAGIKLVFFNSEKALLEHFLKWFAELDPDVILGWNVVNFDLQFLQKKCDALRLKFSLGRGDEVLEWRQAKTETVHHFVLVPGRVVLDGIDTLKAATHTFESFSLEYVSRQLLDRGKLIEHTDNRGEEILRLYAEDKLSLARYNLEDCQLVVDIFNKLDLINFAIERARLTGLPLDKTGGSVAAFENLYLPRLHRSGYVAPNMGWVNSDIQAPGGYVMSSNPGLYEHVLVLDFKSLYPSIIRTFGIDPLSLVYSEHHYSDALVLLPDIFQQPVAAVGWAESDWIPGFNGAIFSKTQHLLPQIITHLWAARDNAKTHQNLAMSQAIKIIMNSFYGVLGTPLCRFFDPRLSSSITLRGHDIMLQTRELIEAQGYEVIYGDTDSVFVWLKGKNSDVQANAVGQRLAVHLNEWWTHELMQRFGLTSCLELEFETHYRHFHMPTMRHSDVGSKKRYAGLIQNAKGEKLVFKGLENVRTDWTHLARELQKDIYWRVFHGEDFLEPIKLIFRQVLSGELNSELLYRKRIRRKLSDYQKNVPPHVQAARKAEAWRREQGMSSAYERGGWIEYYMTVNGAEPAECCHSELDYNHYIERQLAPAVDGLLACFDTSFDEIVNQQLSLFC